MQKEEEKVRKIKDVMKWDFFFFFFCGVFLDKDEMRIIKDKQIGAV